MGKGENECHTSMVAVNDCHDGLNDDWLKPGGPEATAEELEAWIELIQKRDWVDARVRDSQEQGLRAGFSDPDDLSGNYPSRRALEAVLAAIRGEPLDEFRAAWQGRTWSDLLKATDAGEIAGAVERDLREGQLQNKSLEVMIEEQRRKLPPQESDREMLTAVEDVSEELQAQIDKLGPGAKSGLIDDYSRAELRKLLGFLERDCKHLTDDELRSMAMDGELIPRFPDSPSHMQIAVWDATRHSFYGPEYQVKRFRRAMRMGYRKLANRYAYDHGRMDAVASFDQMAKLNPLVAASGHANLMARSRYPSKRPISDRQQVRPESRIGLQTPLELKYGTAFDGFSRELGANTNISHIKTGVRSRRGVYGFYEASSQTIHIHSSLCKIVKDAEQGKAGPAEIHTAVSTIAHEMFHSMEGRDEGNRYAGSKKTRTAEHALDEGATEALARLHTQSLAEKMGVWKPAQGELSPEDMKTGSYQREVETVVAITAAANGELDLERLRAGDYGSPAALSPEARKSLLDTYTKNGIWGRVDELVPAFRKHWGMSAEAEADADAKTRDRIFDLLKLSKQSRFQHRIGREQQPDGRTRRIYKEPDSLSEALADVLSPGGGHGE